MKNVTKLETKLAEAKLEMKLYNAGALIVEAYEMELSYTFFEVESELFAGNRLLTCGQLNLTANSVSHFMYMTNGKDDKFLKKLRAAVKLIETHDATWACLEAHEDLN
tara:strand:+ start:3579 stop:3902 length:324 start_codon:yes stop_codon:yes gene_type:complete